MIEYNPVGMLIYNKEGKLLLGKRSDGKGWGFPGGKTDPNESSLDAAIRETEEETGVVLRKDEVQKLGDCITYDNPDGVNSYRKSSVFFCKKAVCDEELKVTKELTEFKWMEVEKIISTLDLFMPTAQVLAFYSREIKYLREVIKRC